MNVNDREFHYRWEWVLQGTPETLWPLISDTNRFNHDAGVPAVQKRTTHKTSNFYQRLSLSLMGLSIEWDEAPFEWIRPHRFGVVRRYIRGPIAELRILAKLVPQSELKTKLIYQVWAKPRNILGFIIIPIQIGGISPRKFSSTFSQYSHQATQRKPFIPNLYPIRFAPGGHQRLSAIRNDLLSKKISSNLLDRLITAIEKGDDLTLSRLRPYVLADFWHVSRRTVLELFLHATRAGLLEFRWDLLCPLCRGAKQTASTLEQVQPQTHCDTCNIDYEVNFDQSVELTFRPSPSIRMIEVHEYCIGGPQVTPHIVAQQILTSRSDHTVNLSLEEGDYRLRTMEFSLGPILKINRDGSSETHLHINPDGLIRDELRLQPTCRLHLKNNTDHEQIFIIERTAWSDKAVTAAEVTALQTFRDLFANEALRPGEQISVGSVTILFTDLCQSTRLYREIGDAPAFGCVMNHFDILKKAITDEEGAIVKTIGDSVMAIFRAPIAAIRSVLKAQEILSSQKTTSIPLILKAGIHHGPCIVVNLNNRLDYFGSIVNIASRLESISSGGNLVISDTVRKDPEVTEFLESSKNKIRIEPIETSLKGFELERFQLWRVQVETTK